MISLGGRWEGLAGLGEELLAETRRDAVEPTEQGAERAVETTVRALSVRGGPSRPGTPPAMDEGVLRDAVGRTEVETSGDTVEVEWGVGVGREAEARIARHAARLGISPDEILAYAHVHEFGSLTHPARPFARPAEMEVEPDVDSLLRRAFR